MLKSAVHGQRQQVLERNHFPLVTELLKHSRYQSSTYMDVSGD